MPEYKQGKFKIKNRNKYKGNPNNIVYRSGWELKFMKFCDMNENIIRWSSEEIVIPYKSPIDGRWHRYFTDFYVRVRTKTNEIEEWVVEVKPKQQTKPPSVQKRKTKKYINEVMRWGINEAKWEAADEYCKRKGMKFIILTEKELNINP